MPMQGRRVIERSRQRVGGMSISSGSVDDPVLNPGSDPDGSSGDTGISIGIGISL